MDVHIEGKTWYDSLDYVYWGVGTGKPSPKLSPQTKTRQDKTRQDKTRQDKIKTDIPDH